jgi:hypothetical protein
MPENDPAWMPILDLVKEENTTAIVLLGETSRCNIDNGELARSEPVDTVARDP